MSISVYRLQKRIEKLLAAIEARQQEQADFCIVLYDQDGIALPGHEPKGTRVTFWIPDNKRDYNLGLTRVENT